MLFYESQAELAKILHLSLKAAKELTNCSPSIGSYPCHASLVETSTEFITNARSEKVTAGKGPIDPTRLSVDQAARLLSSAFRELVSAETIELDLSNGAPVNSDGTINLVHYSAWQAKEMGRGE